MEHGRGLSCGDHSRQFAAKRLDKALIWTLDHHTSYGFLIRETLSVVDTGWFKLFILYRLCDTSMVDAAGLLGAAASDILP